MGCRSRATVTMAGMFAAILLATPTALGVSPSSPTVQVSSNPLATENATNAKIAYNQTNDQFLVVWEAGVAGGHTEIYGRLIDGAGSPLAPQFQISQTPNVPGSRALRPDVTWNSVANQYLVVWIDPDAPMIAATDTIVSGQRVSATGTEVGTDFPISDIGFQTDAPSVAYNSAQNEYLVAFHRRAFLGMSDQDVFAQRVDAAGAEVGANDFQLSALGGNDQFTAAARIAYNATANEYLVAFTGDVAPGATVDSEAFVQRVSGGGAQVGPDDQRISDAAPNGGSVNVSPTWNVTAGEYLVTWTGSGQRLAADGTQIGGDLPLTGVPTLASAVNPSVNRTLALGPQGVSGTAEQEIFGVELNPDGSAAYPAPVRLTNAGPDGSTLFFAGGGAAAARNGTTEWLVVWIGEDTVPGDGEPEVFARKVVSSAAAAPPNPPPPPNPVKARVTPAVANLAYDRRARRYVLRFTYGLPAGVLQDLCRSGCAAVAELRNRAKTKTFATSIAGDGRVVLGTRAGLTATTGRPLTIVIRTTKAKLQRLAFTTTGRGKLRRSNVRLRVTLTTPTGPAVTAFDGQLQVPVARLRSGGYRRAWAS